MPSRARRAKGSRTGLWDSARGEWCQRMSESQVLTFPFMRSETWNAYKHLFFSALIFCALLALFMRGVFEVTIGRLPAYGMQVGLFTAVQLASITLFRFRVTNLLTLGIVLTLFFGLSAVISSFFTMHVQGFPGGIITTVVNVYLLSLFVVGFGFQTEALSAKPIALAMALAGFLLPVAGLLQIFGLLGGLPGASTGPGAFLDGQLSAFSAAGWCFGNMPAGVCKGVALAFSLCRSAALLYGGWNIRRPVRCACPDGRGGALYPF